MLLASGEAFEFPVGRGSNLQSEHERYLTEKKFERPVILYDYPRNIKPFYMRSQRRRQTVAAMDVLVPKVGEIIGGSQREERLEVLATADGGTWVDPQDYWWYVDLRRYGTVPHSGFGLGLERVVHVRDRNGEHPRRDSLPTRSRQGGLLTTLSLPPLAPRAWGTSHGGGRSALAP